MAPANTPPTVRADMGVAGLETIGFQTGAVLVTGSLSDAQGHGPYTVAVRWTAGAPFTSILLVGGPNFVAPWVFTGPALAPSPFARATPPVPVAPTTSRCGRT